MKHFKTQSLKLNILHEQFYIKSITLFLKLNANNISFHHWFVGHYFQSIRADKLYLCSCVSTLPRSHSTYVYPAIKKWPAIMCDFKLKNKLKQPKTAVMSIRQHKTLTSSHLTCNTFRHIRMRHEHFCNECIWKP